MDALNELAFALYATAHAFERVYRGLLSEHGLTYPQYLVMLVLWEADGVSSRDIARRLFTTSHALSPILKRLERDGFVTRERDASDERLLTLVLTARGRRLREELSWVPLMAGVATGMDGRARADLLDRLASIRASVAAAVPTVADLPSAATEPIADG